MAFLATKDENKDSFPVRVGKTLVKGWITGSVEAATGYPVEFVKTQLQLQSKTNPQYKGMLDCARQNIKTNGAMSLYRGSLPLIFGGSFKQAARWSGYGLVSSKFRDADGNIALHWNMFSGFCAGASEALLAVTPMETVKTRTVDDIKLGTQKYSGSVDAVIKICKAEGPAGLYRGAVPTVLKQGTNQMVRFPIQQFYFKAFFGGDESKKKNPLLNGFCGALSGATSAFLTMPQDVIKSRMQGEQAKTLYTGSADCVKQLVQNEGVLALWTGLFPRIVRLSLSVGLSFTVYPLLNQYF